MNAPLKYFGTTPFAPRSLAPHCRGAFPFSFEELAIFRTEDGFVAARVDGGCEVSFTDTENFEVGEIYLRADNNRNGKEGRMKAVFLKIEDDSAFWSRVHDAIMDKHHGRIVERIDEELAEA